MRLSTALLVLGFTVAHVARADEGADRNEAASELAAAVMPPTQYDEMMDQIVGATVQGMESSLQAKGKALPEGFAQRFRTEMTRLLPYQEMLNLQAGLLAKYYTVEEINELAAFYKSTLGQKTLKVMPSVMADSMGMVQTKLAQDLPATIERLLGTGEQKTEKPAKPEKSPTPKKKQ